MQRPGNVRKVPSEKLYVSEPPPQWFGNPGNPKNDPKWTNENWLKSRFHFSFAEHMGEPRQFGVLRVMNDDLVQPGRQFGEHPHRDMEIITYVVDGALTHKDSVGNEETLGRGAIQFLSAGTGLTHSEGNPSDTPLRFIQSWITPRKRGVKPNYGSASLPIAQNGWSRIAADWNDKSADADDVKVRIHQDCNVYATETTENIEFELGDERQAYLLCVEGEAEVLTDVAKKSLKVYDAAELYGPAKVKFTPNGSAHLLMFEMRAAPRISGRPDAE